MKQYFQVLFVAILALTLSSAASAATITTSGTFEEFSHSQDYSYNESDGNIPVVYLTASSSVVSGLQEFDSSLGTLTGAQISVTLDYELYYEGEVIQSINYNLPYSVYFRPETTIYNSDGTVNHDYALIELDWRDGNSIRPLISQHFPDDITWDGSYSYGGGFDQMYNESFQGTYEVPDTAAYATALQLSDLIGTGYVQQLNVSVLTPEGGTWTTQNVSEANANVYADVSSGTVSIEYEYTPVPVPGSVWLFGSALLGFAGIVRRKTA